MALIDSISNGELGSSIRTKLNAVITWVNTLKTNVTENSTYSLFFGNGADSNVGDVAEVTSVGANALNSNVDGDSHTAIGSHSQEDSEYAFRNTSLGALTMQELINGNYGVAGGYQSQGFGKFIWRNTALGYKAGRDLLVGHDNTAIGYKALQDMNSTNGAITLYTDIGGGEIQVTSAGHGQSNGTTVTIVGTGPWVDHTWSDNYDGDYVISDSAANTFTITAAYVDPGDLLDLGYWYLDGEAEGNTAIGYSAGLTHGKGSFNTILGWTTSVTDPDGDMQLAIHLGLIRGFWSSNIRQRWVLVDGTLRLGPHTDAPFGATEGAMYYNTTDKHFYGYNGTVWKQLDN